METDKDHGRVEVIYRIVGHDQDDIDLTEAQARRTYEQLQRVFKVRVSPAVKLVKKGARRGNR